jgi:hypothetical protein
MLKSIAINLASSIIGGIIYHFFRRKALALATEFKAKAAEGTDEARAFVLAKFAALKK